jgi:hypothetical protein
VGSAEPQKAQVGPVGDGSVPPERQQVQLSRLRCWDFSWRCQSCLVEKEYSVQKVHWKGRSFDESFGGLLLYCRRRRRSLETLLALENWCEKAVLSDMVVLVKPVS